MAKFELKFIDCVYDNQYIKAERIKSKYGTIYNQNEIDVDVICIEIFFEGEYSTIWLDKSTAIKFAKTLRTEINKITESEVNNG
jgi:hypothetical protein